MAARFPKAILALDVGDARIGVAIANTIARLPAPLIILKNDNQVFDSLKELAARHEVDIIIIGLPRNMQGEETGQSKAIRRFAEELKEHVDAQIIFADESLSSKRAEEYSLARKHQAKHLDDIAACFILEEYLGSENG